MLNAEFFITNILLGAALAMDAFSVSLADGLAWPDMKRTKSFLIAGTFAFYQFLMPLLGWLCVRSLAGSFELFAEAVPYIAMLLLGFIGGKMLVSGLKGRARGEAALSSLSFGTLIFQGIATSIDALSAGFSLERYGVLAACLACLIIAAVTFVICAAGLKIGRRAGVRLADKASLLGGIILIAIGIKIFIGGVFF